MHALKYSVFWVLLSLVVACGSDGGGSSDTDGAAGGNGRKDHDLCEGQTCSNHGACVSESGGCICDAGYLGASCQLCDSGYHRTTEDACAVNASCQDADPCSEHGKCNDSTGEIRCECAVGYTGETCEVCYPGYHFEQDVCVIDAACLDTSCAGHGACHVQDGQLRCACDGGYTGSSCQHCDTGFQRDAHDACIPAAKCADRPRYCGDHGECSTQRGVLSCTCATGYSGERCDACYAGYHLTTGGLCVLDETCLPLTCSGRGVCSANDGQATCACDPAYVGLACQECAPDHHRDAANQCVVDEMCGPFSCNGHGSCDVAAGVVACVCEPGYAGALCNACYPGYHRDAELNCIRDELCTPNSCAGHGACSVTAGDVQCVCDFGYAGSSCATCLAGYHRDRFDACVLDEICAEASCSAHGACDAASGTVRCACEPGYLGVDCSACYPGYHASDEGTCVLDVSCEDTTCPDTASCDATGETPRCICSSGYTGSFCQTCAPGYHRALDDSCVPDETCAAAPDYCSGHGACDATSGLRVCTCDAGYAVPTCSSCTRGYHAGVAGECLPDTSCTNETCPAEISSCDDSAGNVVCKCVAGYSGSFCQACAEGYHRDASDRCVVNASCADVATDYCGPHGACTDTAGAVVCRCEEGYLGERCADCSAGYYCSGRATACDVVNDEPVCSCAPGYAGLQCESCAAGFHREGSACVADVACQGAVLCSGHGICDAGTGSPRCICEAGYVGADCAQCDVGYHPAGDNCARDGVCSKEQCSQHGICSSNGGELGCTCYDRYQGANCEACAPGFARVGDICGVCPQTALTFDGFPSMPALADTCVKRDPGPVWYEGVFFSSLSGDSQVLACAPSTIYAMPTKHLRLQVGNLTFADIAFDGPVREVSFHFAPKDRTAIFEILADGVLIDTLNAARRTQATFTRSFAQPIRKLSIRNGNANGTELAIDDLAFQLAACP